MDYGLAKAKSPVKNQLLKCHLYYVYLQVILTNTEQHTFRFILYGEDLVSNLSLHVPWAPRSALWVVGCGSLVTPVLPTCATGSALDVMDYGLAEAMGVSSKLTARTLLIPRINTLWS